MFIILVEIRSLWRLQVSWFVPQTRLGGSSPTRSIRRVGTCTTAGTRLHWRFVSLALGAIITHTLYTRHNHCPLAWKPHSMNSYQVSMVSFVWERKNTRWQGRKVWNIYSFPSASPSFESSPLHLTLTDLRETLRRSGVALVVIDGEDTGMAGRRGSSAFAPEGALSSSDAFDGAAAEEPSWRFTTR